MHAAALSRSPRLQAVHKVLLDGKRHSTRELIDKTGSCAINSIVSELRANGVAVLCEYESTTLDGNDVYVYSLPGVGVNSKRVGAEPQTVMPKGNAGENLIGWQQHDSLCECGKSYHTVNKVCTRCNRERVRS
jgi:hypothetical protein